MEKYQGFARVTLQDINVYGCYVSPNIPMTDFEDYVDNLINTVRIKGEEAVIAEDFNSKAPEWGSPITDRRGQILAEAANGIVYG